MEELIKTIKGAELDPGQLNKVLLQLCKQLGVRKMEDILNAYSPLRVVFGYPQVWLAVLVNAV